MNFKGIDSDLGWEGKFVRKDHPDYSKNLSTSLNFIEKTKKSFLRGMSVKITDSAGMKGNVPRSILNICWKPPEEEKTCKSTFCNPIFMHQSKQEFDAEVEGTFNHYIKMIKGFESERPRMIQKDLLEGKV